MNLFDKWNELRETHLIVVDAIYVQITDLVVL